MIAVKANYDMVTSIHIYSLEPGRIQDLPTLTEAGREVFANTFLKEDPLQHYKKYGIIQNKHVKVSDIRSPVVVTGLTVASAKDWRKASTSTHHPT